MHAKNIYLLIRTNFRIETNVYKLRPNKKIKHETSWSDPFQIYSRLCENGAIDETRTTPALYKTNYQLPRTKHNNTRWKWQIYLRRSNNKGRLKGGSTTNYLTPITLAWIFQGCLHTLPHVYYYNKLTIPCWAPTP